MIPMRRGIARLKKTIKKKAFIICRRMMNVREKGLTIEIKD